MTDREPTANERREQSWSKLNQANTALEAKYKHEKEIRLQGQQDDRKDTPLDADQQEFLRRVEQRNEADQVQEERREAEQARIEASKVSFR